MQDKLIDLYGSNGYKSIMQKITESWENRRKNNDKF